MQYSIEQNSENGDRGITEVIVSEVTEEELDWKISEFKSFLTDSEKQVPIKFIYAAADDAFLERKDWQQIISEEVVTSKLKNLTFSEYTKIVIPREWFDDEGRSPQSSEFDQLKNEFNQYYSKKYKSRRITLIASRTIFNGGIATAALIAGGMPSGPAIVIGSLTGIMSGSLQLVSAQLMDYLETNKYGIKIQKLLGLKPAQEKSSKFLAKQLKWFSTEFAFLAILDIARFSLGVLPDTSLASEPLHLGATALKSLASQGLIDTAVVSDLGPKIREAILSKDFELAAKLRFRNDIISFSSSMAWAAAAITDMIGLPIGNIVFASMGAAGGVYNIKLILRDKSNSVSRLLTQSCHWFFKIIRPMRPI